MKQNLAYISFALENYNKFDMQISSNT